MRWYIGWVHVAAASAVVLAACPSEQIEPVPDAGEDAGIRLTPVELCERMAVARCGVMARCFAAWNRNDAAACKKLEQDLCFEIYTQLKPSFDQGRVEIDSEKVLSCEQRMQSSACTPTFPPNYPLGVAKPFSDCTLTTGLLRGKIAAGATCDERVECAPGTVCVKPGGVCTGTCSTQAAVGEPCSVGCAPGLYCETQGTTNPVDDRCAPVKGQNEACESSLECHPDLWCRDTCRPRGAAGDPCLFDPFRLSTCAPGLACEVVPFLDPPMEGTCVTPKAEGNPCMFHWACAPGLACYDLSFADFPDAPPAQPGSCQRPVALGDPCAYTQYQVYLGDVCGPGLNCNSDGLCVARPVLGEACNPQTQACADFKVYCKPSATSLTQGTCAGAPGLEERCATLLDNGDVVAIPCDTGYCDKDPSVLKCRPAFKGIGQTCESNGECLSDRCAVQEDRSLRCAQSCG